MYGILIKYKSTSNKTFWYDYEVENEDGTTAPFLTDDKLLLEAELKKLDSKFGFENIKIIDDVTYSIKFSVFENQDTSEPIQIVDNIHFDKDTNQICLMSNGSSVGESISVEDLSNAIVDSSNDGLITVITE